MAGPETVRIFVMDENEDPLEGVLVRIFDGSGIFVTQGYSALDGLEAVVDLTLEGDATPIPYTMRLSKTGVAFDGSLGADSVTPQQIEIYSPATLSPTGTNDFEVQGQAFSLPVATDPRLCRASGFFRDIAGRPLPGYSLIFTNRQSPLVVDGMAVLDSRLFGKTDDDGYFELDLYRGGLYLVELASLEDTREIVVPNSPAVNLVNLLFPQVMLVLYSPSPLVVSVGETRVVEVTVTDTTGLEQTAAEALLFTSSDQTIASISVTGDALSVTGVATGQTTIVPALRDESIVSVPAPVLTELVVTVS